MPFLGGNSLDKAPPSSIYDFVKSHGGHTVITKVPIIRTCKKYRSLTFSRNRFLLQTMVIAYIPRYGLGLMHLSRYRGCKRDSINSAMELRDVRTRARHRIHGDGNTRGLEGQCRVYPDGRPVHRSSRGHQQ